MSNLAYLALKCAKGRKMAKKCPRKGSKSQNWQFINKYVNLESKNCPNLKNNWYKHFIIHFKRSIDVKFGLFSFKVCKRTQNGQKVSPKGVKITKSAIIQQICQFGV